MSQSTCAQCGVDNPRRKPNGPQPKYCSVECRRAAHSDRCRSDGRYEQQCNAAVARYVPTAHAVECKVCATNFTAKRKGTLYCSARCARQGGKPCSQDGCPNPIRAKDMCNTHYNATYHRGSQRLFPGDQEAKRKRDLVRCKRRRAVVRGAQAEDVDRDLVGERDKWRCFCGKRIKQRLAYPDPNSASLDHVVPLAEGGPHTYANTRIAHLVCNLSRGARGGGEQLALM